MQPRGEKSRKNILTYYWVYQEGNEKKDYFYPFCDVFVGFLNVYFVVISFHILIK